MSGDLDAEALLGKLYNEALARIKALEDENRDWRMGKLHSPVPHLDDVRRLAAEVAELLQRNVTISQTSGARIGELERENALLKATAANNTRFYEAEQQLRLKAEANYHHAVEGIAKEQERTAIYARQVLDLRAEVTNLRMSVRMLEGEISDDNDAADLAAE